MFKSCIIYYIFIFVCPCVTANENTTLYDRFYGVKATGHRLQLFKNRNVLNVCTVLIDDCKDNEGRRFDGSCNNPKFPTKGTVLQPFLRMLPAHYGPDNTLRRSKDGSELPSARKLRTKLLPDGTFAGSHLTSLLTSLFEAFSNDIVKSHDTFRYAGSLIDCCSTREETNDKCIPIEVPKDDPYLAKSGIRCLNLTRMETFQDHSCVTRRIPAERTNYATPLIDLSVIYGTSIAQVAQLRSFRGGLLKEVKRKGRKFPPTDSVICFNNQYPLENICFKMGDEFLANGHAGVSLIYLWQYRYHNFIARALAKINPCWEDYKLFHEARKINIAINQHIFYNELMAVLMGRDHLIKSGILQYSTGYYNDYNDKLHPGTFLEFITSLRFFHEIQDGRIMRFSKQSKYLGQFEYKSAFYRTGMLEVNQTLEELTQGAFRQTAAKFNRKMDPILSEGLFGNLQKAADISSIDIMRNRDLGLAPYNYYRELCGLKKANYFTDFFDVMTKNRVELLSTLYKEPDDVDLNVGIHAELLYDDIFVGPTLHCIMTKQLLHWKKSDRFWYEHGNHITAFSLRQLRQIRKMTIARMLCDVADDVMEIQPEALRKLTFHNAAKNCKDIPKLNFSPWLDESCKSTNNYNNAVFDDDEELNEVKEEPKRKSSNPHDPTESLFPEGLKCPYGYS